MVLEKTLESPLGRKEIKPVNTKGNQPWIFIGKTGAEAEAPVLWLPDVKSQLTGKKLWCWERLRSRGDGSNRGWDGWMAPLTDSMWVWANSRRQWETRKPGVLQFMRSQRVGHGLATKQRNRSSIAINTFYLYP